MNWDQIAGNWKQLKGKAQAKWGDITDDDWNSAEGRREQLVGLVQEKYGHAKEAAEREVDDWVKHL
ncbi:CsbD family protein [Defluviimonas sp. SAOS-178_SWC]|uniref:CsbD family protein n=1 Tax=Defluviimonas sp. SAOS-178_SWC TaxID=3121287 RepID=UPI003221EBE6